MEIKHNCPVSSKKLFLLFESVGFNRFKERTEEKIEAILKNSTYYLIGFEKGDPIAFLRMFTDFISCCHIFDLCVHPDWQGKGIGKKLMREILTFCDSKEIPVVTLLDTSKYDQYYSQFGFEERKAIQGMYRLHPKFI